MPYFFCSWLGIYELGVSVRSYKRYEKAQNIAKLIELATFALSTKMTKEQGETRGSAPEPPEIPQEKIGSTVFGGSCWRLKS